MWYRSDVELVLKLTCVLPFGCSTCAVKGMQTNLYKETQWISHLGGKIKERGSHMRENYELQLIVPGGCRRGFLGSFRQPSHHLGSPSQVTTANTT